MFLKKIFSLKNGFVNYKQMESIYNAVKPVFHTNLRNSNTCNKSCKQPNPCGEKNSEGSAPSSQTTPPAEGSAAEAATKAESATKAGSATKAESATNAEAANIPCQDSPKANEASTCQSSTEMEVMINVTIKEGTRTTNYEVKSIPNSFAALGEAPHWRKSDQSLFYVDLNEARLLRYDTCKKTVYKCKIQGASTASFVIPVDQEDNKFVVGNKRNVELVIWDGVSEKACINKTLFKVQPDDLKYSGNRFNDGKCDESGRLYAGTMSADGNEFECRLGELYMHDGKETKTLLPNLGISNGMAWNKDKFYFIDMADYNVKEYPYCDKNGKIGEPKVVYDFKKTDAIQHCLTPDGMTIDTDGNLYVAAFNGGTIYKIDPNSGKILLQIKLPVKQVSSCAFGGPNMDTLYVTTSSKFNEPAPAGSLFQVTGLDAKGAQPNSFKMADGC